MQNAEYGINGGALCSLILSIKEHRMNFFYSHTTNERKREGTETLPYKIERSDTGVPEKYCAANFLGRGETNVANLKGLLANLFLLRNLFGRAGVPAHHSSLFTLHYSLRESFFYANRPLIDAFAGVSPLSFTS